MYSKEMTKKRTSRVQASLLLWLLLLPESLAGVLPSLLASDTPSGSLLGATGLESKSQSSDGAAVSLVVASRGMGLGMMVS